MTNNTSLDAKDLARCLACGEMFGTIAASCPNAEHRQYARKRQAEIAATNPAALVNQIMQSHDRAGAELRLRLGALIEAQPALRPALARFADTMEAMLRENDALRRVGIPVQKVFTAAAIAQRKEVLV